MKSAVVVFLLLPSPAFAAWSSIGSLGTFSQHASTAAWTVQTTADLDAGNIGICIWASDGDADSTENDDFTTMTDDAGNQWNEVAACDFDDGPDNAGAAGAIFMTKAIATLAATQRLTINLENNETGKAGTCWEFSVLPTSRMGRVGLEVTEGVGTSDAGPLTVNNIVNREYLWIRAIASETIDASILSQTSGWSIITAATNNTGIISTSMGATAEFIITSADSQESDPTMIDTGADRCSTFIAIKEGSRIFRSE